METFFFYFLAALTIGSALMVPLSRNAVNAAMFMILAFIGTAGFFGLLGSYFLAALQVLVYAGAIMVLFVFIVMMIDVEEEAKHKLGVMNFIAAFIASGLVLAGLVMLFLAPEFTQALPPIPTDAAGDVFTFTGKAIPYGAGLFGKYLLPIQVMGMLLLVAMVGVIVISKNLWERFEGTSDSVEN